MCASLALGCSPGEPLPEVKVHASVSPLAAQALVTLAVNRRVARVVLVDDPAEADLAWFGDPVQALRHAPLLVPGSAPDGRGVAARWKDPRGRFFPVGAHARVFLVNPRSVLPSPPRHLRDLADPRLAGLQAVVPFGRGDGPATFAALALLSSDQAALRLAAAIAQQKPHLGRDARGVQALVARVPGLMPLREDVPLPPSVKSARDLRSPILDWDRLAEADRRLTTHLGRWPDP